MLLLPDIYAFYGFCADPACADSSLIDSRFGALSLVCFGVDLRLGLRRVGLLAGGSPAASNFLLLRQKKVTKEKATRLSGSLRFASGNLRCPEKTGQAGNGIRTAEQPDSHRAQALVMQTIPMSSCHAGLDQASMNLGPWIAGRARNDRHLKQTLFQFPPPLAQDAINWIANCTGFMSGSGTFYAQTRVLAPASVSVSAPANPVLVGPLSALKNGIRAARCLSRRRVCADPRFSGRSKVARSAAQGPGQSGRLSFAYFSLAKQRKVSCRRATPGQQAQAENPKAQIKNRPATHSIAPTASLATAKAKLTKNSASKPAKAWL